MRSSILLLRPSYQLESGEISIASRRSSAQSALTIHMSNHTLAEHRVLHLLSLLSADPSNLDHLPKSRKRSFLQYLLPPISQLLLWLLALGQSFLTRV